MPATRATLNVAWDALLDRLAEVPRENGSPELAETARFLADALSAAGAHVERIAFTAQPYALRLTGILALAAGLLYFRLMVGRRFVAALLVAVGAPALAWLQLDQVAPLVGWIGQRDQQHVVGRIPAASAEGPEQTLIFSAHYDTKTDLLDHVQRAPVDLLAMAVIPFMILGAAGGIAASRRAGRSLPLERLVRFAAAAGAAYGVAVFAALSAGALVPRRSPGALDDGASCALLVRLAESLAAHPPSRTDVEVVLFSAEEVGVQGSWAYAGARFARPPERPTLAINLEGIGGSSHLAALGRERFTLRSLEPGAEVVSLLDAVHRERFGAPLPLTGYGGATDARSFLAHGVPAATLISREPGTLFTRGLHSSADDRERIDEEALDETLAYLLAVVERADAHGAGVRR